MGFWDTAGKIAKGAMDGIESHNSAVADLVSKYENKDTDWLKGKLSSGNMQEKIAASQVLKNR